MSDLMVTVSLTLGLSICGLLLHAATKMATVATKLDLLCERIKEHEAGTKADIQRVQERVDSLEVKIASAPQKRGS